MKPRLFMAFLLSLFAPVALAVALVVDTLDFAELRAVSEEVVVGVDLVNEMLDIVGIPSVEAVTGVEPPVTELCSAPTITCLKSTLKLSEQYFCASSETFN